MTRFKCPKCCLDKIPKGDGYCPGCEPRVQLVEMDRIIERSPMRIVDNDFFSDGC